LERAVALDPGSPRFAAALGHAHLLAGHPEDALPHLMDGCRQPTAAPARAFRAGLALFALGRHEESLAQADAAVDRGC
jgi:hypothetical protein